MIELIFLTDDRDISADEILNAWAKVAAKLNELEGLVATGTADVNDALASSESVEE